MIISSHAVVKHYNGRPLGLYYYYTPRLYFYLDALSSAPPYIEKWTEKVEVNGFVSLRLKNPSGAYTQGTSTSCRVNTFYKDHLGTVLY